MSKGKGASSAEVADMEKFVPLSFSEEARLEDEHRLAKALQQEDRYLTGCTLRRVSHFESHVIVSVRLDDVRIRLRVCACVGGDSYVRMLIKGQKFLKYGRSGAPHWKYVYCDLDGTVYWADTEATDSEVSSIKAAHKFTTDSSVPLIKAVDIVPGKTTDVFKRSVAGDRPEDMCFSIKLPDRTLDLSVTNKTQRDLWVTAFRFALKNLKTGGSLLFFLSFFFKVSCYFHGSMMMPPNQITRVFIYVPRHVMSLDANTFVTSVWFASFPLALSSTAW
jgi:hypothetical protein